MKNLSNFDKMGKVFSRRSAEGENETKYGWFWQINRSNISFETGGGQRESCLLCASARNNIAPAIKSDIGNHRFTQIKNTDRHGFIREVLKILCLSVFICVHLWLQ